ncbi:MAG: MFS transporter [Planctomycetes bacterium]|nr:MFS transporter [Planctomycetota bacterium]
METKCLGIELQTDIRRSNLFALLLIMFLVQIGIVIFYPFLPLFLKNQCGVENQNLGLYQSILVSLSMVFLFVCSPFWGKISEKTGRRNVLLIGLAAGTAVLLVFGMAKSFPFASAIRVLHGICFAATWPILMVIAADYSRISSRSTMLGYMGMLMGIGNAIAFGLGGMLYAMNPMLPFFTGAILFLIALILGMMFLKNVPQEVLLSRETEKNEKKATAKGAGIRDMLGTLAEEPRLQLTLAASFLTGGMLMIFQIVFITWGQLDGGMGEKMPGFFIMLCSLAFSFAQVPLGMISDRIGKTPLLLTGLAGLACSFFLIGFLQNSLLIGIVIAVDGIFGACCYLTGIALASELAPLKYRGMLMGFYQSMFAAGAVLFGFMSGFLLDHFNKDIAFYSAGGLFFLTTLWAVTTVWSIYSKTAGVRLAVNASRALAVSGIIAVIILIAGAPPLRILGNTHFEGKTKEFLSAWESNNQVLRNRYVPESAEGKFFQQPGLEELLNYHILSSETPNPQQAEVKVKLHLINPKGDKAYKKYSILLETAPGQEWKITTISAL